MRLSFLSLSVMAPPHLRPLSFWMNLILCSLLLDRRTSFCLQEHLLAPPHLLLVPLAPLPVLLAPVSRMRFYAPLRRPLRLCHARPHRPRHLRHARQRRLLRPLRLRHARPRPHHPPPSATSRPHSVPTGAPCRLALAAYHLVFRRWSMSSRRSSRAGLALCQHLQRRQLLHLRRHRCLRVSSPCLPSSTSTPWRLGPSEGSVFPLSSPPLPCLRFRRRTAGVLPILPGAPPCWKNMMLY
jgi:hypothetical protein